MANVAALSRGNGGLLIAAVSGCFEGDFQVVTQVTRALGLAAIIAIATKEFVKDAAAATTAEQLAEDVEGIMETAATTTATRAGARIEGGVAVLIVSRTFLRIA